MQKCNTQDCPAVDCKLSAWSDWGSCSASCDEGYMKRARTIETAPEWGAPACAALSDEKKCNQAACQRDCDYNWGEYSACTESCGGGTHQKSPIIRKYAVSGGKACPEAHTGRCNTQDCPAVACVTSDWSDWGDCSATCDEGYMKRSRTITHAPEWGAPACPG